MPGIPASRLSSSDLAILGNTVTEQPLTDGSIKLTVRVGTGGALL
jgi:hypothetical protein